MAELGLLLAGAIIGAIVTRAITYAINSNDQKKVYNWLKNNTKNESNNRFKSTNSIANGVNLTPQRVSTACYSSNKIRRSTAKRETWTIFLETDDEGEDVLGILII